MDFGKCIDTMTCIHHCGVIQNSFTSLCLCALPLHPSSPPPSCSPAATVLFTVFSKCHVVGIIQYVDFSSVHFSSVQSLSHVRLFATPWIAARQASLSITNSQSLLKLMTIESVMPSSHLILCHPLLLLPLVPPSIRVFSNESTLRMRWPKCWNFSFSICPSNEHPGLISFRMDWLDLLAVQGTLNSYYLVKCI